MDFPNTHKRRVWAPWFEMIWGVIALQVGLLEHTIPREDAVAAVSVGCAAHR